MTPGGPVGAFVDIVTTGGWSTTSAGPTGTDEHAEFADALGAWWTGVVQTLVFAGTFVSADPVESGWTGTVVTTCNRGVKRAFIFNTFIF